MPRFEGTCWLLAAVILLAGCGSAHATSPVAAHAPLVRLPADQASHPRVNNEWWYVVGHLRSGSRTFGYEVTTFRLANLQTPAIAGPITIYRTDVAITDESARRFHQQVTYFFPQSARLSTSTLNVRVGAVSLTGASPDSMSLRAKLPAGTIDLHLASRRPPMYVGGRGYIPFGSGFTYYYSLTDLATTGSLTIAGRTHRVSGVSWLDHQWGNWSWKSVRGWTWMALQLSDGVQLSVFDVRGTSGRVRAASVMLANGTLRTMSNATVQALGSWLSPHTGARYPSGWIVRIPSLRAALRVEPTVRDQEVVPPGRGPGVYWEGSGRMTGSWLGRPVNGFSYTELTGFAGGFTG